MLMNLPVYKKATRLGLVLVIVGLMVSCISQKKVMLLQETNVKEVTTEFSNKKKTSHKVQVGDHLYIRIYSVDPKTSKFFQTDMPNLMNPTYLYLNSYVVDEEGFIHFSFIEKLYVKGMSVDQITQLIQKNVSEYFNDATVTVKLVNFQVAVMGEVSKPGNFTIDKDQINVFQAVALAGGFKDFANIKKVTLVRQTLNGSEVQFLDFSDKKILESDYFYLLPNDILYVEPLKMKSYTFTTFPYSILLSGLSVGLAVMVLLK
jgi:polysaccharide biosynthesis/export protein